MSDSEVLIYDNFVLKIRPQSEETNNEYAIAIRSLKHNFDGKYTDGNKIFDFKPQMFLDALGVDFDKQKYKYYILLDELF